MIILLLFSPFDDFSDSRSEDYKLAGKYYAQEQVALTCNYGNSTECFYEEKLSKVGYPFFISMFFLFLGVSSKTVIIANFLFSLILPLLLFLVICIVVKSEKVSALITVFYILSFSHIVYSTSTDVYSVAAFFIVLSILCVSLYFKYKKESLFLLSMYAMLFLMFLRMEYMILLLIFILINLKESKKLLFESRMFLLGLVFLLIQFFHGLVEIKSEGQHLGVLSWMHWYKEVFTLSQVPIYLCVFIAMIICSLKEIWESKVARIVFFHVVLFSGLTLSFQITGAARNYFSMIFPSFCILLAILVSSVYQKFGKLAAGSIVVCILCTLTYFSEYSLGEQRFRFGKRSVRHLDESLAELEKGIVVFTSKTMMSRAIFKSKHTAISNWNLRSPEVVEIVDSSEFENKYFIPSIYTEFNIPFFEYYEMERMFKKGEIEVYRIVRKRSDVKSDWDNVICY